MKLGQLSWVAAMAAAVAAAAAPAPGVRAAPLAAHYAGALADGGTWIADVPAAWNGTLLLYSHGFGTLAPADAPDLTTQEALLDRGYALVGSSYDPNGSLWALKSATGDQFASLAAIERIIGRPRQTLALGTSMGGLISAQEAQDAEGRIDGAVTTCGLVGGGIDLNNYQLDAEYALNELLAPDQHIKLVDYTSPAEGAVAAAQLSALATAARSTPDGRARVALGTALLDMPTWSTQQASPPGERQADGRATAQHDWLVATLPFVMPARFFIEESAGGNASWNVGVDYAQLLGKSPYRAEVVTLYHEAGLDLRADLATLTGHAAVRASAVAVRSLQRSSTLSGHLDVPMLDLHTIYDQLAPVEYENLYAAQVRASDDGILLRQAYVARRGHCAFVASEIVAAVQAIQDRIRAGRWGTVATDDGLQEAATELGLGDGPAFVDFRPGRTADGGSGPLSRPGQALLSCGP